MKSMHCLLLKEGRGSRRKLSRTLPVPRGFPVTALTHTQPELSTHSSPHLLCWCSSTWGQGLLPSRGVPWRELGGGTISELAQHLYEVRVSAAGAHRGRGSGVVQSSDWCWDCQPAPTSMSNTHSGSACSSNASLLPVLGGRRAHTWNEANVDLVFSASISAAWDLTLPPKGWCWPLSREDLAHIWLWP